MARTKPLSHQTKSWYSGCRYRAIELFESGWKPIRIAEALGVSRGAVSQWIKLYKEGGKAALASKKGTGRSCKLAQSEQSRLLKMLQQSPETYGFRGEVWTAPRVVSLVYRTWGIRYHRSHMSRLLKQLGWSPQKPQKRAIQRDEKTINNWHENDWPVMKKKPKRKEEP